MRTLPDPTKRGLIPLTLFILILLSSLASGAYWQTGGGNDTLFGQGYFNADDGFFNAQETDFVTYARVVTNPMMHPLYANMVGDARPEAIVIERNQMRMYENITLNVMDAIAFDKPTSYYRYSFIYDIETNGVPYLITMNEGEGSTTKQIETYKWDNGELKLDSKFGTGAPSNYEDLQQMGACRNTKSCLVAYAYGLGSTAAKLNIAWFDHDSIESGMSVVTGTGTTMTCFPKLRNMVVEDFDNDGIDEYIFAYLQDGIGSLGTDSYYGIVAIQVNSSSQLQVDLHIKDYDLLEFYNGLGCLNGNHGRYMSGVFVKNIDGAISNGREIVVAYMENEDEFKMKAWRSDGVLLDDYPEIFQADGEIISNVMEFNAFPNTGDDDFCVLGYHNASAELDLLCASYDPGETPQTREFIIDISNRFNISQGYGKYQAMTHGSQQSAVVNDGANFMELISSYGVHQLDRENVCRVQLGANIFCLDEIFEAPFSDGVVTMQDIDNIGRGQMFIMTDTNYYGIHDNFINSPAQIDGYTVNPCIDATWKVNTTVEVTITPVDFDLNDVRARAVLYYKQTGGGSDSGWTDYRTSGSTFSFAFQAVNTTASSTLRIMTNDDFNNESVDYIDIPFSVGVNGVEFGSCQTTVTGEAEVPEDLPPSLENASLTLTPETGNFVQQYFGEVNQRTGLGLTVIWLLVHVILAVMIYIYMQSSMSSSVMMGTQAVTQGLLLILGTVFGFVPFGIILAIVVLGIVIGGLWLSRRFTGSVGG